MAENAPPGGDPSNDGSLAGMLVEVLSKFLATNVDDMLPAMVDSYDKATNMIKVTPMIQLITTTGELVDRAQIQKLPVFQLGGGGYVLAFNNLKKGDLGWIKASDRDMSLFLQSLAKSAPNTRRTHSFEDAIFFPDAMRNYTITDGEHVSLQSIDGTKRVAITDTEIIMTSDSKVVMDTPLVEMTGDLDVTGNVDVGIDLDVVANITANNITALLAIQGNTLAALATISAVGDIVAGIISLMGHTHIGSPTAPLGPVTNTGAAV